MSLRDENHRLRQVVRRVVEKLDNYADTSDDPHEHKLELYRIIGELNRVLADYTRGRWTLVRGGRARHFFPQVEPDDMGDEKRRSLCGRRTLVFKEVARVDDRHPMDSSWTVGPQCLQCRRAAKLMRQEP